MSRSDGMTIEEQVMGAARSYLFGHALAWEAPVRPRRSSLPEGRGSRGRRLVATLARRLSLAAPAEPAAEPCGCG